MTPEQERSYERGDETRFQHYERLEAHAEETRRLARTIPNMVEITTELPLRSPRKPAASASLPPAEESA